jgi:hypothetical protein
VRCRFGFLAWRNAAIGGTVGSAIDSAWVGIVGLWGRRVDVEEAIAQILGHHQTLTGAVN